MKPTVTPPTRPNVEHIFEAILQLLSSAEFVTDAGFGRLVKQKPYRDLVSIGHGVLKFSMERLREGALFLIPAILEIWEIGKADLGLEPHATDQQTAAKLIEEWDVLNCIQWTASATQPAMSPILDIASDESLTPLLGNFRFGGPFAPMAKKAVRP